MVDEVSNRSVGPPTVPNVSGNVSLKSAMGQLQNLRRSVGALRAQVGFQEAGKKQRLSRCQKVRVMQACKSDSGCSDEKDRAYVILRDARQAVNKMRAVLKAEPCRAVVGGAGGEGEEGKGKGEGEGESARDRFLSPQCQDSPVFYRLECVKKACVLQKRECKQCLSYDYV